jgi:hypothetical protein
MPRRYLTGLILGLSVLALALWSQGGGGRGWLLAQVQGSLPGYELTYEGAAGNPWRGLNLSGVRLTGPGADVNVKHLEVSYRLGGLVRWELPFSVRAAGLRGSVRPDEIELPEGGPARLPMPALSLQSLEVEDVALALDDVPYTLPDLTLNDVAIQGQEDGLALFGTLTSPEGQARLEAEVRYEPFNVLVNVVEADARLARHWWEGAEGGTLSGELVFQNGQLEGNFSLRDGEAEVLDLELKGISGPIHYRHPHVEATLSGSALGGPVAATGSVDLEAQAWHAEVAGEPELAALGEWLAENHLPLDAELLGMRGRGEVVLSLSGWQEIDLEGRAWARGEALGQSLHDLEASFGFASATGLALAAQAALGEGALNLNISPAQATLHAEGLDLLAAAGIDGFSLPATIHASFSDEDAEVVLSGAGEAFSRPLALDAAATLEGGRWTVGAAGTQGEASFEAALGLEEGEVESSLSVLGLELPWFAEPVTALAQLSGPLESPTWRLEVAGADGPLTPLWQGASADADFAGVLEGELGAAGVTVEEGRLGPLEIAGTYDFDAASGAFRYALAPIVLEGSLSGTVAVPRGEITVAGGALRSEAEVHVEGLNLGPAAPGDLEAALELDYDDGRLTLSLEDPAHGLSVVHDERGLSMSFTDYPVALAGAPWTLQGGVAEDGSLDLQALSEHGRLTLVGDGEEAWLAVEAEPGLSLGPLTLQEPLRLEGPVRLDTPQAALRGGAGELELALDGDASGALLEVRAGEETLALELREDTFIVSGSLPLEPLGALVEAPLSGSLEADFRVGRETYEGRLDLMGEAYGQALELALLGAGETIRVEAHSELLERPVYAHGRVYPDISALLHIRDVGTLELGGDLSDPRASGSGTLEALERFGLVLPPQPWALEASSTAATLTVGASTAELRWGDGAWALQAELEQEARWRELDASLSALFELGSDEPAGHIAGEVALRHPEAAESALMSLGGSLRELQLEGHLPADLLTALGVLYESALELRGELDLLEGPRYALAVDDERGPLLALSGEDGLHELRGEGLEASFEPERRWRVHFDDFDPARFADLPLERLSGVLEHNLESGHYAGEIVAAVAEEPALRLYGEAEALRLAFDATLAGAELAASGTLLPELSLEVAAEREDLGSLSGEVTGELTRPRFGGTLEVLEQEVSGLEARLPALSRQVGAFLSETGWRAEIDGLNAEEEGVVVTAEGWSGRLSLPFELQGEAHSLSGPVGGALAEPLWQASLQGPYAQGEVSASSQGLEGQISLDAEPWGLAESQAEVSFALDSDLRWRAEIAAGLRPSPLPALALAATFEGEGGRYEGRGGLSVNGQTAAVSVRGQAEEVSARLTIDDFALEALELPVSGLASGQVELHGVGEDGWRFGYEAALEISGTLYDAPFSLALAGDEERLALSGHVDEVALQGSLAEGTVALDAAGRWREQALELTARYTPLEGRLDGGEGEWRLGFGEYAASGQLLVDEGGLLVEIAAQTGDLELALGGEAWPEAQLRGELEGALLAEPVELSITGLEEGYRLQAVQSEMLAEITVDADFSPLRAALQGRPRLHVHEGVTITSDLDWSREQGFAGEAQATLPLDDYGVLTLEMRGEGALAAAGVWRHEGETLALLEVALSDEPWAEREISGRLSLLGPGTALLPWPLPEHAGLQGELAVSGTLLDPIASGPLTVRGFVEASGQARLARDGASVSLSGESLSLSAEAGAAGWRLSSELINLDLSSLLPAEATLSGRLSGRGGASAAPSLRAEGLTLEAAESRVAAELGYDDGALWGEAEVLLVLADIASGAEGLLRGPVRLERGGALQGHLELESLGTSGADWSLGGALELGGSLDDPALALELTSGDDVLRLEEGRSEGRLSLDLNGNRFSLEALEDGLMIAVQGGGLELAALATGNLEEGIYLQGHDALEGTALVRLAGGPSLELQNFGWLSPFGRLSLSGELLWQDGPRGAVDLAWTPAADLPLGEPIALEVVLEPGSLRFAGASLEGLARWSDELALEVEGELMSGVALDLRYSEAQGPEGWLSLQAFPLTLGEVEAALSGHVEFAREGLAGDARLEAEAGALRLLGEAGWARLLPERLLGYLPEAHARLRGVAWLDGFDPAILPAVAEAAPELDARLSGVAHLSDSGVIGQLLVPELRLGGEALPAELDFNGSWQSLEVRARLERSEATFVYEDGRLSGFARLEGFPLHGLVEARFGPTPTEVLARMTGLARFDVPSANPAAGEIHVVGERLRLEQEGVASEGSFALRYDADGLTLEQAEFGGAGNWTAQGRLGEEGLDFHLRAEDADFSPLLNLLPSGFPLGLQGTLELELRGDPRAPELSARSPILAFNLGDAAYRLVDSEVEVIQGRLSGRSRLESAENSLALRAEGHIELMPFAASGLHLEFAGDLDVPMLGTIEDLDGTVVSEGWRVESSGRLGQPFNLSGSLSPLDLTLSGERLMIAVPSYYLHASETDVDLRLRDEGDYLLSGELFAHGAQLGFAERGEASQADVPLDESLTLADMPREAATLADTDTTGERNPFLERVRFDDVRVRAPQQVHFRETVGAVELGLDLTLTGTAAEPLLDGQAGLVRGNLRFLGRDFTLTEAAAVFQGSRFPEISAHAETSFEKARVIDAETGAPASFVAPREGASFTVFLDVHGEFVETEPGVERLRLEPVLSSDALVEDRGADEAGARPLQEDEIAALLTLGRLELGAGLRQAARTDIVAQTALDTAVDIYILAELQRTLAEAFGVDLFEIRTTAVSALLEPEGAELEFSIRVGGYLSDELFAIFSVGRADYGLGGGFQLRYDLAPVELTLAGALAPSRGFGAVPEFSLGLAYSISPLVHLGAGLDIAGGQENRFGLRLGLDFRW